MYICIVCICCASFFSYRFLQHISTWLTASKCHHEGITQDCSSAALTDQTGQLLSSATTEESSYHCDCCKEGVLPYRQVALSPTALFMLADVNAAANWQVLVTSVLCTLPVQYGTVSHTVSDIWDCVPHAANVIWDCVPKSLANSTCCRLQHLHSP